MFNHFSIDISDNAARNVLDLCARGTSKTYSYHVLQNVHSTQSSSEPNVIVGTRISSRSRPSRRNDCFRALYVNSFSGIEGEWGRVC